MTVATAAVMRRMLLAVTVPVFAAACGGSPAGPTETTPLIEGRTTHAITSEGASASVRVATRSVQTAADGTFRLELERGGEYVTNITARGFVERETLSRTGVNPAQQIFSLIPDQFDLRAFDELARTAGGRLQRWTRAPGLVILTSVMTYNGPSESSYAATGQRLSDAEVAALEADFTRALPLLTGNTWRSFSSVVREAVDEGTRATVQREGVIVAGRYRGIVSWSNTIGLGRWFEQPDGTVTAGTVFLEHDFDSASDRRWLLRMHELGHALGYTHVTSRFSVMNPMLGPEPTAFDAEAMSIAYQRMPGNRPPDVDPSSGARSPGLITAEGGGRWASPVICGMPRSH